MLKRILEERWLYLIGWIRLASGLALGRAILSISVIVISGSWLIDAIYRKDLRRKWRNFIGNRPALLITSIPILYAISLLYSSGLEGGLKNLNTQIPLLFLPMVFSSMPALTAKHVKGIALVHVAALILSTLISYVSSDPLLVAENPRMISLFVNHIRLSLLLVMGIVLIIRYN